MLHSPMLLTMAHINVHLSISVNICQYLSYSPIWPAIPYQTCRWRLPWLLHFVFQGVQRDIIIISESSHHYEMITFCNSIAVYWSVNGDSQSGLWVSIMVVPELVINRGFAATAQTDPIPPCDPVIKRVDEHPKINGLIESSFWFYIVGCHLSHLT